MLWQKSQFGNKGFIQSKIIIDDKEIDFFVVFFIVPEENKENEEYEQAFRNNIKSFGENFPAAQYINAASHIVAVAN
ncbi:MAG TPA: hypothetical protein PK563_14590 [Tenuifilaceae bacterium]|nr:hypothetical protein [Tenuifilaceae bacterium]